MCVIQVRCAESELIRFVEGSQFVLCVYLTERTVDLLNFFFSFCTRHLNNNSITYIQQAGFSGLKQLKYLLSVTFLSIITTQERMKGESESPIHGALPMKII